MSRGRYAVLRCIADPGRQEALNLGILLWDNERVRMQVDERAALRVARNSIDLASADLVDIGGELGDEIAELWSGTGHPHEGALQTWMNTVQFPFQFSEIRETTIGSESRAIDATLERLLRRIVMPRGRETTAAGARSDPVKTLARSLEALVRTRKVERGHRFRRSRSGVERQVAYFANSTSNTALDVVRLTARSKKDVRARGDAAAFKVEDIVEANSIEMIVLCALASEAELTTATADALTSLRSVGAKVHTDPDAASDAFRRAVIGPTLLD